MSACCCGPAGFGHTTIIANGGYAPCGYAPQNQSCCCYAHPNTSAALYAAGAGGGASYYPAAGGVGGLDAYGRRIVVLPPPPPPSSGGGVPPFAPHYDPLRVAGTSTVAYSEGAGIAMRAARSASAARRKRGAGGAAAAGRGLGSKTVNGNTASEAAAGRYVRATDASALLQSRITSGGLGAASSPQRQQQHVFADPTNTTSFSQQQQSHLVAHGANDHQQQEQPCAACGHHSAGGGMGHEAFGVGSGINQQIVAEVMASLGYGYASGGAGGRQQQHVAQQQQQQQQQSLAEAATHGYVPQTYAAPTDAAISAQQQQQQQRSASAAPPRGGRGGGEAEEEGHVAELTARIRSALAGGSGSGGANAEDGGSDGPQMGLDAKALRRLLKIAQNKGQLSDADREAVFGAAGHAAAGAHQSQNQSHGHSHHQQHQRAASSSARSRYANIVAAAERNSSAVMPSAASVLHRIGQHMHSAHERSTANATNAFATDDGTDEAAEAAYQTNVAARRGIVGGRGGDVNYSGAFGDAVSGAGGGLPPSRQHLRGRGAGFTHRENMIAAAESAGALPLSRMAVTHNSSSVRAQSAAGRSAAASVVALSTAHYNPQILGTAVLGCRGLVGSKGYSSLAPGSCAVARFDPSSSAAAVSRTVVGPNGVGGRSFGGTSRRMVAGGGATNAETEPRPQRMQRGAVGGFPTSSSSGAARTGGRAQSATRSFGASALVGGSAAVAEGRSNGRGVVGGSGRARSADAPKDCIRSVHYADGISDRRPAKPRGVRAVSAAAKTQ